MAFHWQKSKHYVLVLVLLVLIKTACSTCCCKPSILATVKNSTCMYEGHNIPKKWRWSEIKHDLNQLWFEIWSETWFKNSLWKHDLCSLTGFWRNVDSTLILYYCSIPYVHFVPYHMPTEHTQVHTVPYAYGMKCYTTCVWLS